MLSKNLLMVVSPPFFSFLSFFFRLRQSTHAFDVVGSHPTVSYPLPNNTDLNRQRYLIYLLIV